MTSEAGHTANQSLDEFVAEVQADVLAFAAGYRAQHANLPDIYPLTLPADNSGLWLEFFVDYMTRPRSAR